VTHDGENGTDADLMAAVSELAGALRELVEVSVTTTVGPDEIRAATELARGATERLAAARRPASQLPALDDPSSGRRVFNPVSGAGNPMAPPLVLRQEEGGVVGEATLGVAYEGPPSYVHGGMSALLMDQVLGTAAANAGLWGMTAHLELDYRGPLPVGERLVLRGRVAENDGRKSLIVGTIALAASPAQPLVEARGLFVLPRKEKLEAYFGAITDASGEHRPPSRAGDATAVEPADGPAR
jgi:acyl-coenzyme A thioesterase PaaI-like protein